MTLAPEERPISFRLNEEQEELARTVRRFLDERSPVSAARRQMATEEGFDREVWTQLSSELGLSGLHLDERFGGAGYGYVELGLVLEEMGRVLYSGPFLASAVLSAEALRLSGDEEAADEYLPPLATGDTIAALALAEGPGLFSEARIETRAEKAEKGWVLSGEKGYVLSGGAASLLVVAARGETGVSLFLVDAGGEGVAVDRLPVFDETRHLARVSLKRAPARLLGREAEAWPACEAVFDRAAVALACDALGVAERSMEMTVAYAMERHQFGRPIGSFQAIKHRCADMLVSVELARSAVFYATRAVDSSSADVSTAASIALAQAAEAAFDVTAGSIQVHGGIGFTWEHDAHLYFKRARADGALLGTVEDHRERLLQTIGL